MPATATPTPPPATPALAGSAAGLRPLTRRERALVESFYRHIKPPEAYVSGAWPGLLQRCRRSGLTDEDVSSGIYLGVHRAAQRYDPSLEAAFAGYAMWQVRSSLQRMISAEFRLDFPFPIGFDFDGDKSLAGIADGPIWAVARDDPDADPAERDYQRVLTAKVRAAVAALPGHERAAVEARFGLDGSGLFRTWDQVCERLGVTDVTAIAWTETGLNRLTRYLGRSLTTLGRR